jgi:LysM repeat protein
VEQNNNSRYAFLIVFISFLFVIGSLIAVFAETNSEDGLSPAPSSTPLNTDIVFDTPTLFVSTASPSLTHTLLPSPSETVQIPATETESPPLLSQCNPPDGWMIYFIQIGETLESIADKYGTTAQILKSANCLTSDQVLPGYIMFVPPEEQAATDAPDGTCTKPAGWITYTVKSGDTLFQISRLFQTTVSEIQAGNCMGSSTKIITGTRLWVPNNATLTPTSTATTAKTNPPPTKTATDTPVPNTAPVAFDDGPYSVALGGTLKVSAPGVLSNDTDNDADTLTVTLVVGPVCATSFLLNPDGSFTYIADSVFCAASDAFTYKATDGTDNSNIATVTINLP